MNSYVSPLACLQFRLQMDASSCPAFREGYHTTPMDVMYDFVHQTTVVARHSLGLTVIPEEEKDREDLTKKGESYSPFLYTRSY